MDRILALVGVMKEWGDNDKIALIKQSINQLISEYKGIEQVGIELRAHLFSLQHTLEKIKDMVKSLD